MLMIRFPLPAKCEFLIAVHTLEIRAGRLFPGRLR
jgi:hypothetical protein